MLNNKDEYIKMANAERELWWYKALHDLVINTIESKYDDNKDIIILDAGCGTGGLLQRMQAEGYKNIKGFDLSSDAIEICKQRSLDVAQYGLNDISKHHDPGSYDVIICNDVMVFFISETECKKIITQFYNLLKPGGLIIMNNAALDIFRGTHDKALSFDQRFTKEMICSRTSIEKLKMIKLVFWPFFLSIPIAFIRTYQRLLIRYGKPQKYVSDVSMPNRFLNTFLYHITKFENNILRWKPFGSSLFVVLEKSNLSEDGLDLTVR